jgi:hypothetical protein
MWTVPSPFAVVAVAAGAGSARMLFFIAGFGIVLVAGVEVPGDFVATT